MKNAIEGLTDKENPDKPVDPDNPTGPIQPVDPENPGNQSGGSKNETNTGDVTNLAISLFCYCFQVQDLYCFERKADNN